MNRTEVKDRIKGLDEPTAKAVVCALVGHSMIQNHCFGYFTCARCGEQVGDSLGGVYSARDVVIVGHNCDQCQANYAKLDWRSKFMVSDPFT